MVQNPWTRFDPEGLAESEIVGQVYDLVNHETKELYVGQVNGAKRMEEGGAANRLKDTTHPAKELLNREGTIRNIQDVEIDGDWRNTAKENGMTEASARSTAVKAIERAKLEEMIAKYPDYKVVNKLGEEEGSLGQGISTVENAKKAKSLFNPRVIGKVNREITISGTWTKTEGLRLRPMQGLAYTSAIGLALMVVGEASGANAEAVENVRQQLQFYKAKPDVWGASLGNALGTALSAPDSSTVILQKAFMEHADLMQ